MKYPVQNGKEVIFENMKKENSFTLKNQERELYDFGDTDIEVYLEDMFAQPGYQFVVLAAPVAQNGIRFVQATVHKNGELEVELGVEGDGTRLVYKICSVEECYEIFFDFYENCFNPDLSEYKPVQFMTH